MGTLPSGLGLISGFDTTSVIQQMLAFQTQGRNSVQTQLGLLQARRSAMLDLNASLLSLFNTTQSLGRAAMFDTLTANSSNAGVLSAALTTDATAGTYQFLVAGLASHHQLLSAAVASDVTSLGLAGLSLEQGGGSLRGDVPRSWLNGGTGVDRGEIRLTNEVTNAQEVIDLRDVMMMSEIIDRLNDNTLGITARLEDGKVVLEHVNATEFSVLDVGTGSAAVDLGVVGQSQSGMMSGHRLLTLGGGLSLAALADGNGLLIREGSEDLQITTSDGRTFPIDLGPGSGTTLTAATLLASLNGGDGVSVNAGDEPDLLIGVIDNATGELSQWEIDLSGCVTVGDVQTRINEATGQAVTVSIVGRSLRIDPQDPNDTVTSEGVGSNGGQTAADLGLDQPDGSVGGFVGNALMPPIGELPATLQSILNAINMATDLAGEPNDGAVVARISADGMRLELEDFTAGDGVLLVTESAANAHAVHTLGWSAMTAVDGVITGRRILGDVGTVLTSELNGGLGLQNADDLTITDPLGNTVELTGLSVHETLADLLEAINLRVAEAGVSVTIKRDQSGTGVVLQTDAEGGSLVVAGAVAERLHLAGSTTESQVSSGNLQHRWISAATPLADLNVGLGIGNGSFQIRDARGATATVTVSSDQRTLQDLIDLIHSQGLEVEAKVNKTGDGLALVSTVLPGEEVVPMRVESISGTAAVDLRLEGQGDQVIEGRWETVLEIDESSSLREIMNEINSAEIGVTATLVNTNTPGAPWRLSLTSDVSGAAAEMYLSTMGTDLLFEEVVAAQDARVVLGGDPAAGVWLTSGSNQLEGLVEGLSLSLHEVSDQIVSVTVSQDDSAPQAAVQAFVDGLNAVLEQFESVSGFDPDTGQRGVLYGDSTTGRVRRMLIRAVQGSGLSDDVALEGPWRVGIRMGTGGRVEFDTDVFAEAWSERRSDVEAFFTLSGEDTADGRSGFGVRLQDLIDQLTRSGDGTLAAADDAWAGRISVATDRLEQLDARLEARRLQLISQFTAMEEALSSLQNQYLSILSIGSGTGGMPSFLG